MRKLFFIIGILVLTTMAMQAQNKLGYFIEDNIQIGAKQHGMTTVMDNLLVGIEPVKNLKVMFDWQGQGRERTARQQGRTRCLGIVHHDNWKTRLEV